ncbi:MAG: GNAT family N-acetyltransferase [Shimia sp.]
MRKRRKVRALRAPPPTLRAAYRASLPEPQEYFLQEITADGEVWGDELAYAILSGDSVWEVYVENPKALPSFLIDLRKQRPFTAILCQSFDTNLRAAAGALTEAVAETAYLFRTRITPTDGVGSSISMEEATRAEAEKAHAKAPDYFASLKEAATFQSQSRLWTARRGAQIVGYGTTLPIEGPWGAVDIGMTTLTPFRRQGIGAAIVSRLANLTRHAASAPSAAARRITPDRNAP